MWSYRGHTHYLDKQGNRLGVAPVLVGACRHNKELFHLSSLLAQLCDRYHRARKEAGQPIFGHVERLQIQGTLAQAELDLQKLHTLAGSAAAMLADAYEAFGVAPPARPYEIMCDHDVRPPICDGTVGDVETIPIESLAESG